MNAICLDQPVVQRHVGKQERRRRQAILAGQQGVSLCKLAGISGAVIGRYFHADQQDLCPGCLSRLDHRRKIFAHFFDPDTAQSIIATEFNDQQYRLVACQRLGDSRTPAAGCIARNAGIHNLVFVPLRGQPLIQKGDPVLVSGESVARTQAVTDHEDFRFPGAGGLSREPSDIKKDQPGQDAK